MIDRYRLLSCLGLGSRVIVSRLARRRMISLAVFLQSRNFFDLKSVYNMWHLSTWALVHAFALAWWLSYSCFADIKGNAWKWSIKHHRCTTMIALSLLRATNLQSTSPISVTMMSNEVHDVTFLPCYLHNESLEQSNAIHERSLYAPQFVSDFNYS